MVTDRELTAQNEMAADLITQATHISRVWVMAVSFFVYLYSGNFLHAVVFYTFMFFLMYRVFPVKIKDKDRVIHLMVLKAADRLYVFILKNIYRFVRWYMAGAVVMIAGSSFAQTESVPEVPPPPPEIANQQTYQPPKQDVIKKDVSNMSAAELTSLVLSDEIRSLIIRQQLNLEFGGAKKYYLKDTNYFSYHPDLPVLFRFDKDIRRVLLLTAGAKVVYEDNYLFLAPPPEEDGKVLGFTVVFEDGSTVYFAGERMSFIDNRDIYKTDKKVRKTLGLDGQKKETEFYPDRRKVVLYYIYTTPVYVPVGDVIAKFISDRMRCPADGETFTYQGQMFRFVKQKGRIIKEEDEVYACGSVFKLVNIQ